MRKNKDNQEKVFTTLDAYLAGYLELRGFTPTLIPQDNGRKIVFAFSATEDLYKEITNYNNGATVEANRLALTVKSLKSQIFSLRKVKENDHP